MHLCKCYFVNSYYFVLCFRKTYILLFYTVDVEGMVFLNHLGPRKNAADDFINVGAAGRISMFSLLDLQDSKSILS